MKRSHCQFNVVYAYSDFHSWSINVSVSLQGILLACKINWLDDPKLRDICMTLEEFPISD